VALLDAGDAAQLVEKIHMPRVAPELAVGDGLKPDVFLHADDFADRGVLCLAQLACGDLAATVSSTRIHECLWAQQTADVLCAEWGLRSLRINSNVHA